MFRRLVMVAAAIPAAGVFSIAEAQQGNESLVNLAVKEITLAAERDCVDLGGAKGAYNGIRVRAKRGNVAVTRVSVRYSDGSVHNEDRMIDMKQGERSRPINATGDKFVDHINLTVKPGKGTAVLEVLGMQSPAAAGRKRLPLDKPVTCAMGSGGVASPATPGSGQQIVTKPTEAAPTTAQAGKPLAGGEVLFGTQYVGFGVDRDVIRVGNDIGKFDRVRLRVLDNDIFINDLKVIYANGEPDTLAVGQQIGKNSRTNWLNLKGDRFIKEIQMSYRSKPSFKGQARVEVFGEYAAGWLGPNGEGRKFNEGWVLLGAQTAGFVGFDKDTIQVGRNEGGFAKIRVTVRDRAITLNELRVIYANGADDIIPVRTRVDAGSTYGPIDLKGDKRAIEKIEARYRSRFIDSGAKGKGNAVVEVWGRH